MCVFLLLLLLLLYGVRRCCLLYVCEKSANRPHLHHITAASASYLKYVGRAQRGHELHERFVRDAMGVLLQRVARGRLHHVQQLLVAQVFSQQLQSPPQIILGNIVLFLVYFLNPCIQEKNRRETFLSTTLRSTLYQVSHNFQTAQYHQS